MSADLQTLLDIQEITLLKSRYCRFVDTKQWAEYGKLLAEDYSFEAEGHINQGRDHVVAYVKKALDDSVTIHQVHNPQIEVNGDVATGVWAMIDYVIFDNFTLYGYGWYNETYVRTSEGWRLKKCVEKRQRVNVEGKVPEAMAKYMATLPGYSLKLTA